jgi:hypothetical protein
MTNENEQFLELTEKKANSTNNTSRDSCSSCSSSDELKCPNHSDSESPSQPPVLDSKLFGLMNGNHDKLEADSFNYAIELKRGDFKPEKCFYPQTLNSKIHPVVKKFFEMDSESIACRYAQINPVVNIETLKECLKYKTKYFKWSGK